MIRQAISCDICGAEKKQTNHWFVACEQAGEMRVSGWNSRIKLRAGSKHLCGQTCLHKLLDDFLARTVEGRSAPESAAAIMEKAEISEASLTAKPAFVEEESSARLITPVEHKTPVPVITIPARVVEPPRPMIVPRMEESAADAARRRRAEAWERERAREMRVGERRVN